MMKNYVIAAAMLAGFLAPATATASGRIAVIAASPSYDYDIVNKLVATGLFSGVDYINATVSTPTLARLQEYQSVFAYSNGAFHNRDLFGNVMDSYLRSGGGVVVGVFGFTAGYQFGGAFANDYALLPGADNAHGQRRTLGTVLLPNDPLMAGVTTFDGGSSSYYSVTGLVPGAVAVANYDNGVPLVAKRTIAGFQTVNLNFFAASSDMRSDLWVSSTGGTTLVANALQNVGLVAAVPEPATWAMMLVGFGMIGATARYRRRRTATVFA